MRHIDGMNCCMANVAIQNNILVKNLLVKYMRIEGINTVQVIYCIRNEYAAYGYTKEESIKQVTFV